jgi:hypothetical protein
MRTIQSKATDIGEDTSSHSPFTCAAGCIWIMRMRA